VEQSRNETEIREVLAGYEDAMRRCDAADVVARYAPDLVQFTLAPPLVHRGPEILDPAALQAWFDGHGAGPMDYTITDLDVTAGADVAFCRSVNRMGAPGGFTLWFRASYGLRRVDGAWLIAHEHTSTPFYMDGSLRAALDLTP
jgi:ketosteroid isomerase-like protein